MIPGTFIGKAKGHCFSHGYYLGPNCPDCYPITGILDGFFQLAQSLNIGPKMEIQQTKNGFIVKFKGETYCFESIDNMIKFIQDTYKKPE